MKLLVLGAIILALAPAAAPVVFEEGSVRVGDAVITDLVLQLKETAAGHILVSKGSVEPLSKPVSVTLAPERTLVLEPGVRVSRVSEGFALTVHNRRRIELEAAGEKMVVVMPVAIEITANGWKVAGKEFGTKELTARRMQDDVDQNLGDLGNSAKRILNTNPKSGTAPNGTRPVVNNTTNRPTPGVARGMGSGNRVPHPQYFGTPFLGEATLGQNATIPLFHASPAGF